MFWQPRETNNLLMFRHVGNTFINGRSKVQRYETDLKVILNNTLLQLRIQTANVRSFIAQ